MHTTLWRRERSDALKRQLSSSSSNNRLSRASMEEALLLPTEDYEEQDPGESNDEGSTSLPSSVCNLVNTLVGAGIVALPRLLATLGVVLGAGSLLLVSLLSIATLIILTRASNSRRQWRYTELLEKGLGPRAATGLQWCVVLNNSGLLVTYLIMLGDVLVGKAPGYTGVVSNLLGVHGSVWYATRYFAVAVVCVVFLAPLCSLRSLKGLVGVSILGMLLALAFGVLSITLAVLAALQGRIHHITWWPNPDLAGSGTLRQLATFVATFPVAATAYICHYQIHPLMTDLRNFTVSRMLTVVYWGMGISTAAYLAVAVGLQLVFQGDVQSDVLLNFVPGAVSPLVGEALANPLCYAVWLGYAANLIITYPMILWSGREMELQLLLRQGPDTVSPRVWAASTLCTLAGTYTIAMLVPDIWPVITITGATAGVAIGYAFPACLYATLHSPGPIPWGRLAVKWGLLLLSAAVAVIATAQTVWQLLQGPQEERHDGGVQAFTVHSIFGATA